MPIGPREPSFWVWTSVVGLEDLDELSRQHPTLPMSIEGFEDFRDEIVTAMVIDGETRELGRRPALPDGWGSFHDEDGRPLDPELLARAGSTILVRAPDPGASTLFCGLETALAVSEQLGRFVADVRDFTADDAPTEMTLDAVARLGQMALRVSAASRPRAKGELSYLLPLRLTQSVVHAGRDEYRDRPGNADWLWWLGLLVGATCELIDEAHMCDVVPEPDRALSPGVDHRDQGEVMEFAARSLVTTCVQALALFGSEHPALARTGSPS